MMRSSSAKMLSRVLKRNLTGRFHTFADQAKKTLMMRKQKRQPLGSEFRRQLIRAFEADIRKLEDLTGRSLSHWLE